jgi:hypothetical protein
MICNDEFYLEGYVSHHSKEIAVVKFINNCTIVGFNTSLSPVESSIINTILPYSSMEFKNKINLLSDITKFIVCSV